MYLYFCAKACIFYYQSHKCLPEQVTIIGVNAYFRLLDMLMHLCIQLFWCAFRCGRDELSSSINLSTSGD